MVNNNLYKSPPMLSGELTPDNLQIWETVRENSTNKTRYYTLVYITPKGHMLPMLSPYRCLKHVKFVKDDILGYFHNPLEHHTEEELKILMHITKYALVRSDMVRSVMSTLNLTEKRAKAVIAKYLNPEGYNPFIYGINPYYRGFNFYSHKIWETGILPPKRRIRYILTKQIQ